MLTVTEADNLENLPLNTMGIPFIAYKNTVSVPILHLIIDVTSSDSNSTGSGVMVVCNLGCPAGPVYVTPL